MAILQEEARNFGVELTPRQVELLEDYYRLLIEWNARVNLTGITDYAQVQVKHFLDSLSVARALPRDQLAGTRLVDIGSGAGFPGIPLAIAFPALQVTLIEATGKKVSFLEASANALRLENLRSIGGRAEDLARLPAHREQYDFAVARAVAELRILVELALPFVRVGGTFIAQKSVAVEEEVREAQNATQKLGGRVRERIPVQLPSLDEVRQLVVIDKTGPSPAAYPRRAGMPTKRPL